MAKQRDGKQWERIIGSGMEDGQKARQEKNKSLMGTEVFIKACGLAKIPVTKRQASKFNNKKGIAYKQGKNI